MDRGGWQATVHGVTKQVDKTERLNNNRYKLIYKTEIDSQLSKTKLWILKVISFRKG